MTDHDDKWFDALAGKAVDDSDEQTRDARALRKVLLDEDARQRDQAPSDVDGLLTRLEDEGLLETTAQRARPRWLALAASVVVAAIILPLGTMMMRDTTPVPDDVIVRDLIEPQVTVVEAPEQVAGQIADALSNLGIDVEHYPYDDVWIVDASVPADKRDGVEQVLSRYGLVVPAAGRVVIELRDSAP